MKDHREWGDFEISDEEMLGALRRASQAEAGPGGPLVLRDLRGAPGQAALRREDPHLRPEDEADPARPSRGPLLPRDPRRARRGALGARPHRPRPDRRRRRQALAEEGDEGPARTPRSSSTTWRSATRTSSSTPSPSFAASASSSSSRGTTSSSPTTSARPTACRRWRARCPADGKAKELSVERRMKTHEMTTKPPSADRVQRWRKQMTEEQRLEFEEVAGDLLDRARLPGRRIGRRRNGLGDRLMSTFGAKAARAGGCPDAGRHRHQMVRVRPGGRLALRPLRARRARPRDVHPRPRGHRAALRRDRARSGPGLGPARRDRDGRVRRAARDLPRVGRARGRSTSILTRQPLPVRRAGGASRRRRQDDRALRLGALRQRSTSRARRRRSTSSTRFTAASRSATPRWGSRAPTSSGAATPSCSRSSPRAHDDGLVRLLVPGSFMGRRKPLDEMLEAFCDDEGRAPAPGHQGPDRRARRESSRRRPTPTRASRS